MSVSVSVNERLFPEIGGLRSDFIKGFAEEMRRRGLTTKVSKERGFDLIYSDIFGEAKIYVIDEGDFVRFGYRLNISVLLFILLVILPLIEFNLIILSVGIAAVWAIKIVLLKSNINECAQNTYVKLSFSGGQRAEEAAVEPKKSEESVDNTKSTTNDQPSIDNQNNKV
ncbi:MAG: hypothetical protein NDF52_00160 [archaeon YNP-WB-062]|jgi:hypothetical protein|nr:hypothetical protein [Candidatus Culexarchaeum yellowstonense]